jgi:tetratricopeptide (TPR) repeat protein
MKLKNGLTLLIIFGLALPALAETKTAILPFEVLSVRPEIKLLGADIAENVSTALSNIKTLNMIEQNQTESIMNELGLKITNLNSDKNAIRIGKYLEAEILVPGTLEFDKGQYKLMLRIIGVKTGKVIKTAEITAKDISDLQMKISDLLINQQKLKINKDEKDKISKVIRSTKSGKALNNYLAGVRLSQLGGDLNYQEAINSFNKAYAEDRNFYFALAGRAKAQALWAFQQKQAQDINYRHLVSQSEEDINQVLKNTAGFPDVYKAISLISYINEDYSKGQLYAKKVIENNPHDSEAHLFLWLNNGRKLTDKSIQKAEELNSFLPLIHAQLAAVYQANGKTEEALKEYQEALKINNKNAGIHYNIADIYYKTGRFNDAIQKFKEALKVEPDYWLAFSGLAEAYKHQDHIDEAVTSYNSSLKINPNNPDAHLQLGNIYTEQGELEDAVNQYKQAISQKPDNYESHYNLGIVYKFQDKMDESVGEYKEAIRLKPNFAEAYYNLGIAYKYQGKFDDAIAEYKEALKLNPNFAEAHLNLGVIYFEQNKSEDAIREYKEALRIKPDYARARINLGSVYQKQGKLDNAVSEFMEALKINANYASAYYNLGLAYNLQKKAKDAAASMKKACELGYKPACG